MLQALSRVFRGKGSPQHISASGDVLERELLRVYIPRETTNAFAGQSIALMMCVMGYMSDSIFAMVLGVTHFVVDVGVHVLLWRMRRVLATGKYPARDVKYLSLLFYVVGFMWAMVSWPGYTSETISNASLMMAVTSAASLVIMSNSTALAPSIFRAVVIGFLVGMIVIAYNALSAPWYLITVATVTLCFVVMRFAKDLYSQMATMLAMQFERDDAIKRQQKTIRELDEARRTATVLASTDTVTGLPNRKAFLSDISAATAEGKPFTLMLLDLDLFKNINDALGHHVGDAVLIAVADALRGAVSDGSIAARLGGDEFALILRSNPSPEAVLALYEGLSAQISRLSVLDAQKLAISATAGSACFPQDGADTLALLSAADMAQREAKRAQRGTYLPYRTGLTDAFQRETRIATLLQTAIQTSALCIHYQPQVNIATAEVTGVEALTRIAMPELAAYPMQEIFDVAERRGLGDTLSETLMAVMGYDIRQLNVLIKRRLTISVNLSKSDLKAPQRLLMRLERWIAQGIDPAQIRLEITEDAVSGRGLTNVLDTLQTIVDLGFSLSLDDFGTGEAPMSHIKGLPVCELKIDRNFIHSITTDLRDQAIVKATLVMCRHLGMDCVAEGVETLEQAGMLRELGVTTGQGYLWAKPMPKGMLAEFVQLFGERKKTEAMQMLMQKPIAQP